MLCEWGYELDDTRSCRCDLAKSMNVRHHVMSSFFLLDSRDLKLLRSKMLALIVGELI